MNIKIKVINQLTGEVKIDTQIEVTALWGNAFENHAKFRAFYPDCQVEFCLDNGRLSRFICSPALNMELDEKAYHDGLISWERYLQKWFN